MASNGRERVIVVLSLSGGNDGLNTLVPYTNSNYYGYRPTLGVSEDQVLRIDDEVGLHPSMTELKDIYDQGNMAIIQGVGYPNPSRSHFRSMDIWHTCEPDKIGDEGWLGRAIRELDPNTENVLTGVNFGRGLPRALVCPGVPVASVGNLETYGLLTGISGEDNRGQALEVFSRMYAPAIGSGPVMDYIWETGRAALKGADILKVAPERYSSSVEYGNYAMGQSMRGIAQVHFADLGTRVLYTTSPLQRLRYPRQRGRGPRQAVAAGIRVGLGLLRRPAGAQSRRRGHHAPVQRVRTPGRDNGGGTDHGTGSVCFVIGDEVKGGLYGEYPSLNEGDLEDGGDLLHTVDFRSVYATMLERWIGLDPRPHRGRHLRADGLPLGPCMAHRPP